MNLRRSFGRLTGITGEESDAKIREAKRYSNARAYGQYTEWESLRVWNSIWFLLPAEPGRRKQEVGGQGEEERRAIATPEKGVLPGACDWPDILQDPATHIANYQLYDPLALRSLRTSDDSSHFQPAPVTSPTFSSSCHQETLSMCIYNSFRANAFVYVAVVSEIFAEHRKV